MSLDTFFGTRFLACFHPKSLNIPRKWTESPQQPMQTEPQEQSCQWEAGAWRHTFFYHGKWLWRQQYADRLRRGVHPPLPSCTTINFKEPSEMSFMLGSPPSCPSRIGFPLPKRFCLPSNHHFQTDTGLNYHLFPNVIRDMFTPQCLTSLFTVTQKKSVTLCFAAKQLLLDSEAGRRYHLKCTKLI